MNANLFALVFFTVLPMFSINVFCSAAQEEQSGGKERFSELESQPDLVLLKIVENLSDSDLVRLSRTSKILHDRLTQLGEFQRRKTLSWKKPNIPSSVLGTFKGPVNSVAFSPNGKIIAACSGDGTIRLWETGTGRQIHELKGHSNVVSAITFSPDGTTLVSGSWDGTIRIWDTAQGTQITALSVKDKVFNYLSLALSPDGKKLAAGSDQQMILLWDIQTSACVKELKSRGRYITAMAFSPDGNTLAVGSSGTNYRKIELWDANTGELSRTLEGHKEGIRSLKFSPNGMLASGSDDGKVKLWITTEKKEYYTFKIECDVDSVAFSPDGNILAIGAKDGKIRIIDIATKDLLTTLQGHTSRVLAVMFSPDSRMLISGSGHPENTVRIWETK